MAEHASTPPIPGLLGAARRRQAACGGWQRRRVSGAGSRGAMPGLAVGRGCVAADLTRSLTGSGLLTLRGVVFVLWIKDPNGFCRSLGTGNQLGLVNRKTEPRWYGPYKVIAYVAYRTVQIQLPARSKVWPHFHVSRLKPYKPPLDESGQPTVINFPDLSEELTFEVKKIVAHRYRSGKHKKKHTAVQALAAGAGPCAARPSPGRRAPPARARRPRAPTPAQSPRVPPCDLRSLARQSKGSHAWERPIQYAIQPPPGRASRWRPWPAG
eukprot:COSAG05_NODE_1102_length_5875_cov_3.746364_1_plen_268_part_00